MLIFNNVMECLKRKLNWVKLKIRFFLDSFISIDKIKVTVAFFSFYLFQFSTTPVLIFITLNRIAIGIPF